MAEMANQQQQGKVLRIGIVKDGKVVHEKLIKPGQNVTLGDSPKNTFAVTSASLPKRHTLFAARGGEDYSLQLTEQMDGRIATRGGIVGLAEMKEQGLATRKGDSWVMPLEVKSRGKVVFDDYTVLFQFVAAPPESARVVAGSNDFRPRLIEEDDPLFLGILALFSGIAAVLMIYVYNTEPVEMVGFNDIPDRFVDIVIPPSDTPLDEPKIEIDEAAESELVKKEIEEAKKEPEEAKKREPKTAEEKARDEAKRLEKKKEDLTKKSRLLAGIIGTRGVNNSGEVVEDVFADNDASIQDLNTALQSVGGIDIASEETMGVRGGSDKSGRGDAGIGDLAKSGGGEGKVGSGPTTKAPTGKASMGTIDVTEGENVDKVKAALRKYQGQVKYCSESRLKANPNISGRIAVDVVIVSGAVRSATIAENTTGDKELEACVTGKIRKWRFDADVSDSIYLPFALSPS